MARPLRVVVPGGWYHVVNRRRRRGQIFLTDEDRRAFLGRLAKVAELPVPGAELIQRRLRTLDAFPEVPGESTAVRNRSSCQAAVQGVKRIEAQRHRDPKGNAFLRRVANPLSNVSMWTVCRPPSDSICPHHPDHDNRRPRRGRPTLPTGFMTQYVSGLWETPLPMTVLSVFRLIPEFNGRRRRTPDCAKVVPNAP